MVQRLRPRRWPTVRRVGVSYLGVDLERILHVGEVGLRQLRRCPWETRPETL